MYGLSIASFEAWRLWSQKQSRVGVLAASAGAIGIPFLPFLYLLVKSPTWGLSGDFSWQAQGKFDALTMMVSVYSDLTLFRLLLMIASALWFGIHRKLIRIHPAGVLVAVVLFLAFLAMPRLAFGSWMADQRLMVGMFVMTLGFRVGRPSQARGQSRVFCHLPRLGRVPGRRCFGQLVGDLATAS